MNKYYIRYLSGNRFDLYKIDGFSQMYLNPDRNWRNVAHKHEMKYLIPLTNFEITYYGLDNV